MTGQLRDLALGVGLAAYGVKKRLETGGWRTDLTTRNGAVGDLVRHAPGPRILVHGVSVGETNALEPFVEALAASRSRPDVVVSASTATGFERARRIHAGRRGVVRFPLDFTWMVSRFLDAVRPDLVVLAELELWPTFMAACRRRRIPLCVVNGRLSERSFRGYRSARSLTRQLFRRLDLVIAQTATYSARFVALGTPAERVVVGGNLKWDAALRDPDPALAAVLAAQLGIDRSRPLIVAGSTGPGEEEALLRSLPHGCQLLLAPRNPDRWDEVAALVPGMPRRSDGRTGGRTGGGGTSGGPGTSGSPGPSHGPGAPSIATGDPPRVFLLDTLGELAAAYLLADAVFVGRSLAPMGGSNPIEPVALGKPAVIGPHHENFAGVVAELVREGGLAVSAKPMAVIEAWLGDEAARKAVVAGGARALERNRGSAARAAARVLGVVGRAQFSNAAAAM